MKTLKSVAVVQRAILRVVALAVLQASAATAATFPIETLREEAQLMGTTDQYGVAISGDNIAVGAHSRVNMFQRENGNWKTLSGSLARPREVSFGQALALEGDTLLVGAPANTMGPGSCYIYKRSDTPGLNAWNITDEDDQGTGAQSASYGVDVPPAWDAAARTNGWRYRLVARFVDDFYWLPTMVFLYGDGATRYGTFLDLTDSGDLVAVLLGAPAQVLTTNGNHATEYHTHELIFNPTNQQVTYYFDGRNVHTWAGQNQINNGIFWGWGSTTGKGSMNVHQARFEVLRSGTVLANYDAGIVGNAPVDLDPVSQGWSQVTTNGPQSSAGPVSPDVATVWPEPVRLIASDGQGDDRFGGSIALSGNTAVVGANGDDDGGIDTGSAYVFVKEESGWVQQKKLAPSLRAARDYFGQAVAIDGDRIVVGAPHPHSAPPGRVFIFVRNGTDWTQEAMLTASDGAVGNAFGSTVAIHGDRIAITAEWDDHTPSDIAGSVYIFERTGSGTWTQKAKVFATNVPPAQSFGGSLAMYDDVVLIGGGTYNAHWLYAPIGNNWAQIHFRTYPGPTSVAIDSQTFIVGISGNEVENGAVYVYRADYGNAVGVAQHVRKHLYYADAKSSGLFDPEATAFRYKRMLYGQSNGLVRARHELMPALYGQAERDLAQFAMDELLKGLSFDPDNPLLGNLLLDICYDRTVADTILAREVAAAAERARFGPPIAPSSPTGFLIDNEISLRRQVLTTNRFALQCYFDLLKRELQTQTPGEGTNIDAQFGYRVFQTLVPGRGLAAATYTNTSGADVIVGTNAMLFSGYKDLVLLFDQLRDCGNAAVDLGRLLFARGDAGDINEARELAGEAQRFGLLHGNLLKSIFPSLPPEGDPSTLAQAIDSWNRGLTSLRGLQQTLAARINPLGFDPDFLMLSERITSGAEQFFDSFDAFAQRMDPDSSDSPMGIAVADFQQAHANYSLYRGFEDQVRDQLGQATGSYEDRLFQIVGAYPGTPAYSDNPTNNRGSELDQQYRSIDLAKLRIRKNAEEIKNLKAQVQIEVNRAASVSNAVIRFANRRAELAQQIAHAEAVQEGASALADALSVESLTTGLFIGFAINAVVQAGAEEVKGSIEVEKEIAAGLEQATIEGINSAATVKTLLLQMNTLAIDSQEAALLLQQEMARLVALYREKQQLEARIAESNADLSNRYYADPVHRITAEASLIRANLSFEDAQRWVFFLTRAFHYKWNTPFVNNGYLGRNWNTNSVFKVRNAQELRDLYLALVNKDATIGLGLNRDNFLTSFSVRKDFFGLEDAGTYTDPVTLESLSAIEAFRRQLQRTLVTNLTDVRVEIDFSTVREKVSTSFFLGPRFNANGQPVSPGRYLDKIVWLKIKIPGSHTTGFTQANGDLTYGGISFIRRQNVGSFDPERPDRIRNEMTAFSTRFWFFDTALDRFRFNDGFISSGVQIELSPNPDVPPSVEEINDFSERSVAASNWRLSIPIRNGNTDIVRINQMDDVLIFFQHQSVSRQMP